jgi:hypothetical protein
VLICHFISMSVGRERGVKYLVLRLVLTLNNPQNSEMKFRENMKFTC